MATGGSRSGHVYNANQYEIEEHYQGGCHPGSSFRSTVGRFHNEYQGEAGGHRGGGEGQGGGDSWRRGRGGGRGPGRGRGRKCGSDERRPAGFGPHASRFDDDIYKDPSPDRAPVADVANVNVYWEWCEKNRSTLKSEPMKFEEPRTDFHLQVSQEMRELRGERKLLTDRLGRPISDCRSSHSNNEMCQFCDGDQGMWASKNPRTDKAFQRYQNSILSSCQHQEPETDVGASEHGPHDTRPKIDFNPLKLAPREDPVIEDSDYGPKVGDLGFGFTSNIEFLV